MDAKKLIKNLQNIDAKDIQGWLKSNPNNLIAFALVIISIFAVVVLGKTNKSKEVRLSQQVKELEEKKDAVDEYKIRKKSQDKFVNNFPSDISDNEFVNKLADFASINNVRVESFSPAIKQDYKYMKLTTITIDVSAKIYANIVDFIKDIEDAPYAMRIEEILMKSSRAITSRRGRSTTRDDKRKLATITISAVHLNTI